MKKFMLVFCGSMLLMCSSIKAQTFINDDDFLVNGYSRKISGLDFEYHSCIPGLRESLLIRAVSGKDFLEWETDPVTTDNGKKYTAVIWVAALGSSPGKAGMDLVTDQGHQFTFQVDGRPAWTLESNNGASLSFTSIMVDQFGDHHGYMVLRIPSSQVDPGKPLRIKVTGHRNDLTSWYMTFKKSVKTGVTMSSFPALIRKDNSVRQLVETAIFYFGKEAEASIYANNKLVATSVLKFGYNAVNVGLPPVSKPSQIMLKVVAGKFSANNTVTLNPVRKWKIDLIQHSHTDIGYTRSQTEILAEHLRYIDYALDYCDATDSYPDNAKFRWTCEASWPVDEYLKCRPAEQVERLIRRIHEGRIEVTGMYFNFDEIPDEQILAASLEAAGRIKEKGIPVNLAMQNDVNGIGWCMNDYFNLMGIRYLNMGTHGHRALICFDKPTMFWWESPSGKRILTFRAEHYMTGNTVFEMQTGDIDKFRNNLLGYLKTLEARQYPFDEMAIQHSGYLTDNSPPSTIASDLIKQWNEIYEWPKLTTSTAESFFKRMESDHSTEFPVIRGAWPDWWTDGFGSTARETAATRKASVSLLANMGGLSMAALAGIRVPDATLRKIDLANEALLFYTEHTTGYSESVREPFSLPTMEQRALKESYAWEANRRTASAGEDAMGLLQSLFSREKDPSLLIFNTLSFKRSGLVTVYIDHQIVPRGMTAGIYDRSGVLYPAQALSHRADGTYWIISTGEILPFGYKKFIIKALEEKENPRESVKSDFIENKWYRIEADISKGTIKSLYDKELSHDLVDSNAQYGLAEFILEKLGNRSQMESRKLDDFSRHPLDTVWLESVSNGPVFSSMRFCGESETAISPRGYSVEFRLYNTEKRIGIECSVVKKSITDPESFYIAFPFDIPEGKHFTEVQGGIIEAGKDQIPGSSNDWYTVQNFTSVRGKGIQLVIGCSEMPLMQLGAINTGRYKAGALPQGSHLYSWPMNNYWVTNFNADQRGGHSWSYYITTSQDVSSGFATRAGWGFRIPFLSRIIPGNGTGDSENEGSFVTGWPDNVILLSARPATDGCSVIIHLRETGGQNTELKLTNSESGKEISLKQTDVTGKIIPRGQINLGPQESKFFLLENSN